MRTNDGTHNWPSSVCMAGNHGLSSAHTNRQINYPKDDKQMNRRANCPKLALESMHGCLRMAF